PRKKHLKKRSYPVPTLRLYRYFCHSSQSSEYLQGSKHSTKAPYYTPLADLLGDLLLARPVSLHANPVGCHQQTRRRLIENVRTASWSWYTHWFCDAHFSILSSVSA
ncbi:unnamed protein product, partial [Ectocarpus sp. 4 AP-2014]